MKSFKPKSKIKKTQKPKEQKLLLWFLENHFKYYLAKFKSFKSLERTKKPYYVLYGFFSVLNSKPFMNNLGTLKSL